MIIGTGVSIIASIIFLPLALASHLWYPLLHLIGQFLPVIPDLIGRLGGGLLGS